MSKLFLAFSFMAGLLLATAAEGPLRRADRGKSAVEMPMKDALGEAVRAMAKPAEAGSARGEAPKIENPKVAPGTVMWKKDFAAACAAANASGKPVLLFQLLGRLDDEFC